MKNEKDNVVELPLKQKRGFPAVMLCLSCFHKWIDMFEVMTSLFIFPCPVCKAENSFGSIMPVEYHKELMVEAERIYPDIGEDGNSNSDDKG